MGLLLWRGGPLVSSAVSLGPIRRREPPPARASDRRSTLFEMGEGLTAVWQSPVLRAIAVSTLAQGLGYGVFGALWLVYGLNELGLGAGASGTTAAVGGLSSLAGALAVRRTTDHAGLGRAMTAGLLLSGVGMLFIPLAGGPALLAAALQITQQVIGDGAATVYEINQMSLRQGITPDRLLGRVNASLHFLQMGGTLAGSLVAGALTGVAGMRPVLLAGASCVILGAVWLMASPAGRTKTPQRE